MKMKPFDLLSMICFVIVGLAGSYSLYVRWGRTPLDVLIIVYLFGLVVIVGSFVSFPSEHSPARRWYRLPSEDSLSRMQIGLFFAWFIGCGVVLFFLNAYNVLG